MLIFGKFYLGYVENHIPEKALDLFEQMHLNLENTTYTKIFGACAQLVDNRAKKIGKNFLKKCQIVSEMITLY